MLVPRLEKSIGIEVYGTSSLGVGGVIRQRVEDFVVEEVLVDGSRAKTKHFNNQVLGSSSTRDRYLICVLIKRDWDTLLALEAIANQLDINPRRIQIAGIKDAKAVTAQHITIEGVTTEDVQKIQIKDLQIHPIGYYRSELSSYYLLGNYFRLIVRGINRSEYAIKKLITKTVEELKEIDGVPNFFGHQRFGTIRPITHLVGKAMIQRDLRKAAMIFLAKPSAHEHPQSRQVREQLQSNQDFKKALKNFPKQLRYERWMLNHLSKRPDDFTGAFRRLPKTLRRLFPQAYQAYLFNKFLSRRMEKEIPLDRAETGDYVVNVELSGLPMLNMRRIAIAETVTEVNKAIQAGKMRLALPLIGFKQNPSGGVQGEIERQILEEEGITLQDFKTETMPEISQRGQLRTTIVPVKGFSANQISPDPLDPLKYKAEVSFMLHRGSYATVVLRELMKPRNMIEAGF